LKAHVGSRVVRFHLGSVLRPCVHTIDIRRTIAARRFDKDKGRSMVETERPYRA
jgi:hypothetical protein